MLKGLLIGLFGSAIFSSAVFAQGTPKSDPVLIYREAGVNAEQESQIRQAAQDFERPARVRIERLNNLAKALHDLSFEPEPDENKILSMQEEMNQVQSGLNMDRIKLMLQIRKFMSLEQKQKLVQLMRQKEAASKSQ
ncbi:MAG: periplasmic heavy metal sensor [Candidatus Obscuribacterales bacterium]|nr:periplasmic heavy metal sensor [Candidatus Obscuribacterales bacterium]